MNTFLRIEGPLDRDSDWGRVVFEFHATHESGTVARWVLEFRTGQRRFTARPAGDVESVNPKMLLALGHRPFVINGGICDYLRGLLSPADLALCAASSLQE